MSDGSFVGRTAELAQLRGLLTAVAAGVGGVVLVEGEQGIGKSALLRTALAAAADGIRVLWGTADELGQQFPLGLMADCVGSAGAAGETGGLLAAGGGIFAGDPVVAGVERLLARVDRLCAQSPVVLVAEDLQWADEASVLVWHRLSRAVGQLPLLLAGACQPGTGREDLARLRGALARSGSIVSLGPLADAEVSKLVGGRLGGRPGPGLAELAGRAGGNPLYARELADGLVREGQVRVAGGVAELAGESGQVAVPASLAAAIAGRLGWLAEDVVEALRWAAVLGQEFWVRDLEVVTGRPAGELMGVVAAAVGAGVVAEAGLRLRFRHGLIRQALLEGMPAGVRAALHLHAARALAAAGAAPERVATQLMPGLGHDAGAGEPPEPWIVPWLADAAPALRYRAPQVAAKLLRDVLGRLPDGDPHRDMLEASLVTVAFRLVRHEEVERVGGRLLGLVADPDLAAEMAWLVGYTLMRTDRAAEAAAAVTKALTRPGVSDTQLGRLRALHSIILTVLGRLDEATQVAKSALASAKRIGDSLGIGYALHGLATVCSVRPDDVGRLGYIDQALDVIGDEPHAIDLRLLLLSNRPAALVLLDRQAEAIATARQALTLAERTGTPRQLPIRTALANLYFGAGKWDDALAVLELVVGLPSSGYHPMWVHGLYALIAGHRDDLQAAQEHLAAVRDQQFHDVSYWMNAYCLMIARAMAAERANLISEAAAVLAQYLDLRVAKAAQGRYLLMPMLTRLALAAGDTVTAAAAAQAAQDEAQAEPLAVRTATAGYCRGLLYEDPAPVLAAAAYFKATGRPIDRGQALEDAAVLAAARGDMPEARNALAEAVGVYSPLGAQWDIRRAAARLRPYGIRMARRAYRTHPTTGWDALTPTEVEVARLVATGQSNPDVAARLFLSRNTVQTHVSHILAKLGARSRAEIVREALQHPSARHPARA